MDLHLIPGAVPTPEERLAVDAVLGPPRSGWDGGPRRAGADGQVAHGGLEAARRRDLLLPALHGVQGRIGFITEGSLNYICRRLTVPPAEAYGVATFYAMLALEPRPKTVVHVCDDIACRISGALDLCRDLEKKLGPAGEAKKGAPAMWLKSPCLGQCERAPAVMFQAAGEGRGDWSLAPAALATVMTGIEAGPLKRKTSGRASGAAARASVVPAPQTLAPRATGLRLLRRVGVADPESLDDYRAHGGYAALRRAVALGPEGIIREVLDSKLVGRGGAAFPTGRKWEAVARQPVRPHYLVCNADESEPGTFKDRLLMEEDPFALVEAMTIAAHATACERGYIYIRGEYPLAIERLQSAVEKARNRGFLGDDILGEGLRFDIEIRRGAGAYICGEETALFNSIEGHRGEPRNKPPFPVQVGLFGKPTAINNVETLVNVLDIVLDGGPAFAAIGSGQSTGPKLFCVSGHAARPGLYEVPFGTTLKELIDLAGGVRGGSRLQAVLLGGAAGVFVTPAEIEVPLTFEGTRAIGATLGSGVVMLFDDTVGLQDIVLRIAAFFRDESCGQCVPCRVGTVRQEEALHRLASGHPLGGSAAAESALIDEVAQAMRDASICGLGQTAASVVQSAIKKLGVFGGNGKGRA
ncbi:MAG TPA: NAD(P)H-dependent oxidoreductase subunit E [Candidatus Polarisedimenticolia bacterium]|jgi:NADH-quinone oxidoreductase subunit F|nr:NAD(P)H-dependent oxidoreductase subunit E [Candidatus Polarisedimenticolia bacterium]